MLGLNLSGNGNCGLEAHCFTFSAQDGAQLSIYWLQRTNFVGGGVICVVPRPPAWFNALLS